MPSNKTIISVIIVGAAVCIMLPNLLTFIMSMGRMIIFIGLAIVVAVIIGKMALAMNKPASKSGPKQAYDKQTSDNETIDTSSPTTTESDHNEQPA